MTKNGSYLPHLVIPLVWIFSIFTSVSITYAQHSEIYLNDNNESNGERNSVPSFELDEIVVTASRVKEPIAGIPRNIALITAQDIEQSPGSNVVDLIARESGVIIKNHFGNDKWAGVDIRGMGATASSNVIVMVDGVRLNPPDMSGPDLSAIPIDTIEKVEILHGSGGALYGDGAVGGVINIITKKGTGGNAGKISMTYGSYATRDARGAFNGTINTLQYNLHAGYVDSHGYRKNNGLNKKNLSFNSVYAINEILETSFNASLHSDLYGLPGHLNGEHVHSKTLRRETESAYDSGKTDDYRYSGEITLNHDIWGDIKARCGYRSRENLYSMGFNPNIPDNEQLNKITEKTGNLSLDYTTHYHIGNHKHRFRAGIEYYETGYIGEKVSQDERKNSALHNSGAFIAADWSLKEGCVVSTGYRKNWFKGRYRTDEHAVFRNEGDIVRQVKRWRNGEASKKGWGNEAYDAGIILSLNQKTSFFSNLSTSFRIPNVDEFAEADQDLHPQKGLNFDIGLRHKEKGKMELSLTFFAMRIKDEIYYYSTGQTTGVNLNYDHKTLRKGVETEIKMYPLDSLYLWGNYSLVEARLEKSHDFIPLVPEHKASIGMEWQPSDAFLLSSIGTFIGSSFDGNETTNTHYDKLGGYEVIDAKLTYQYKSFKFFAGINNCLNEYYSTISYSGTYYPMPLRNYYGGVEWRF